MMEPLRILLVAHMVRVPGTDPHICDSNMPIVMSNQRQLYTQLVVHVYNQHMDFHKSHQDTYKRPYDSVIHIRHAVNKHYHKRMD